MAAIKSVLFLVPPLVAACLVLGAARIAFGWEEDRFGLFGVGQERLTISQSIAGFVMILVVGNAMYWSGMGVAALLGRWLDKRTA